ncbi:MAG TPA: M1 family metallopeptidase [Pseudonocardia sp.]|jgi:aminopeptidase N|nr:M1 family metallopeptidase [Pseudonocardia sp.]
MPIRSSVYAACAVVVAALVVGAAAPVAAAPPDPADPGGSAISGTVAPVAAAPPEATRPGGPSGAVGAPGVGDPFFPLAGNGGIDVQDYDLRLSYNPATDRLEGTATLRIVATQELRRFDLDLRKFTLGTVTVDGVPAAITRDGQELQITPKRTLRKGAAFTVVVPYAGVPEPVVDPDGSSEGFVPTKDGAVVVNEPQGSPGWYPANDTPRDKATYTIAMTVPAGVTAVGNGALVSQTSAGGRTTFTWRERFPMAPYLTTITLGKFGVTTGRAGSIPTYVAVDPTQATASAPVLRRLPEMVAFLQDLYGPYPFETVGAIVDNAPELGYALETQTKPVFDRAPDELTLLHELSHQWYGDAVTLRQWPDIWLHEGFATWSEWIWTERHGGQTAAQRFAELAQEPGNSYLWNPPPGDPGEAANLFAGSVYDRGAMTLQALREKIGDPAFFTVMRRWYAEHKYGNVSTPEFVALAQQVSQQDLGAFFKAWLYTPGKPAFLADDGAPVASARLAASEGGGRRR